MAKFSPYWYKSSDGLRLYARDYPGSNTSMTLLCMHGLTRNSADFDSFINALDCDYPVISVDQRGRGLSDYDDDPSRYQIPVYAADMFTLLAERQIGNVVLIGTSMGGLIAMQMLAMHPSLIHGVVLNDIGAVINGAGLSRIQQYVGVKSAPIENWQQAAQQAKAINAAAFPDYTDEDWLRFAHCQYRENDQGLLVPAYDPAIAQSTPEGHGENGNVSLWPLYDSLSPVPMLVIRGALSDILSQEDMTEMANRKPETTSTVEIPARGHAPALDEPVAIQAIRDFLSSI